MKYLRVTMSDGSEWDIIASIIAKNRAHYYAEYDTGETEGEKYDQMYADEYEYTLEDEMELIDWASNNMNWSDVAHEAKRVIEPSPIDPNSEWSNADKHVIEK